MIAARAISQGDMNAHIARGTLARSVTKPFLQEILPDDENRVCKENFTIEERCKDDLEFPDEVDTPPRATHPRPGRLAFQPRQEHVPGGEERPRGAPLLATVRGAGGGVLR